MQNRNSNIDERLQILNDYIQRTIDALNVTRQVAQGLSSGIAGQQQVGVAPQQAIGGLSHASYVTYGVPQLVQTPQGFVAVVPQFAVIPQQPFAHSYGLNHASFIQAPVAAGWQVGYPQVGLQQLGGLNYGWTGGLNHATFMPATQFAGAWPMSISQWPIGFGVGASQMGLPHTAAQPMQSGLNQASMQGVGSAAL